MTTNPHTGAVQLTDADGATYTLCYGTNEMVLAEEAFGTTIIKLADLMQNPEWISMTNTRKLVWCGLQDAHEGITEKEVGKIIDAEGGLAAITDKMQVALLAAFPDASGDAGNAAPASDPKG